MHFRASTYTAFSPHRANASVIIRLDTRSPYDTIMSLMRGVSSPTAASPRSTSSSPSNSASIHACVAASPSSFRTAAIGSSRSAGPIANCVAVSQCRILSLSVIASAVARSPFAAVVAAEISRSVTFAMALTTTTGCSPWLTRPATIRAVRRIALASSTEVPPNFITTSRFMPALPPDRACPAIPAPPRSAEPRPPPRGSCCATAP